MVEKCIGTTAGLRYLEASLDWIAHANLSLKRLAVAALTKPIGGNVTIPLLT
jgi:hypothetical protein